MEEKYGKSLIQIAMERFNPFDQKEAKLREKGCVVCTHYRICPTPKLIADALEMRFANNDGEAFAMVSEVIQNRCMYYK